MRPVHRQVGPFVASRESLHGQLLATDGEPSLGQGELTTLERDPGTARGGRGADDRLHLGVLPCRDHQRAVLHDPGLHGRDLGRGLAEAVGVVHAHRCEHRHIAIGGVRGVPRTPHADFDDRHVDGGIGERDEREHRQELEERQRVLPLGDEFGIDHPHEGIDLVPGVGDGRVVYRLTVDQDALGEAVEVGTREQAGAKPVRTHERLDHAGCRGLSVRARDVHHAIGALRIVEQVEHPLSALDPRLHPSLTGAVQKRRVDGVGSLAIGHRIASIRETRTVTTPAFA